MRNKFGKQSINRNREALFTKREEVKKKVATKNESSKKKTFRNNSRAHIPTATSNPPFLPFPIQFPFPFSHAIPSSPLSSHSARIVCTHADRRRKSQRPFFRPSRPSHQSPGHHCYDLLRRRHTHTHTYTYTRTCTCTCSIPSQPTSRGA
ncbi:hypothetical protein BDY21DRAFT_57528 [Lineolata rhizophorae]|uniref:Uncharacterized protein n=1 Tax=Lineolata rhizophorae TaxID=578093 RepID=A0A6A6NWL4_9PEZI|nr:hypothetical protein BDY21DRAFT_57528 [Lineolata rhizophorae]